MAAPQGSFPLTAASLSPWSATVGSCWSPWGAAGSAATT